MTTASVTIITRHPAGRAGRLLIALGSALVRFGERRTAPHAVSAAQHRMLLNLDRDRADRDRTLLLDLRMH